MIVDDGELSFFLAGDTSYTQQSLVALQVDGVSSSETIARRTLETILRYAEQRRTVYLPTHDPESAGRLSGGDVLLVQRVANS